MWVLWRCCVAVLAEEQEEEMSWDEWGLAGRSKW